MIVRFSNRDIVCQVRWGELPEWTIYLAETFLKQLTIDSNTFISNTQLTVTHVAHVRVKPTTVAT